MAYSLVQEARDFSFGTSNTATFAKAFTSNVTLGNLLVVWMDDFNTGTTGTVTVSDSRGNTWNQVQTSLAGGSGRCIMFWAVANSTGSCTVTFNAGGHNFVFPIIQVMEFGGGPSSPLETSVQATGSSTSPQANITVSGTADLIVAAVVPTASSSTSTTAGWTAAASGINNSAIYAVEVAAGTFTPTFSMSTTGGWGVIAVAFRLTVPPPTSRKSTFFVIC